MKQERGFSLIEVLVAISVLSILALVVTKSTISSYVFLKRSERASLASQLALDKMESLAAINPVNLAVGTTTESSLERARVRFDRVTTITANTNGTKTVRVVVESTSGVGGRSDLTSNFAEWGNS